MQRTDRVDFIWVLREGFLEGVQRNQELSNWRGRAGAPGRGDSKGKGPKASLTCSKSWRNASVAGARGERERLTQEEPPVLGRARI